jgi:chlorophyllide a reductase subunit Y
VINLCVPTASGVPLQILPKEINGVRVIGIDVPGFGVPTHAEAKDVLSAAMLKYARSEIVAGPVAAPRSGVSDKPTVTLLGEMFPADPMIIGGMLEMLGLAAGPTVPTREWRELYAALDCAAVAAIHPFYTASLREFEAAGRGSVGSAPVGHDGTEAWLQSIGDACNVDQRMIDAAKNRFLPAIKGALSATRIDGRITLSGYEGSELLVGRLLVESGADLRYVGTACPQTAASEVDRRSGRASIPDAIHEAIKAPHHVSEREINHEHPEGDEEHDGAARLQANLNDSLLPEHLRQLRMCEGQSPQAQV